MLLEQLTHVAAFYRNPIRSFLFAQPHASPFFSQEVQSLLSWMKLSTKRSSRQQSDPSFIPSKTIGVLAPMFAKVCARAFLKDSNNGRKSFLASFRGEACTMEFQSFGPGPCVATTRYAEMNAQSWCTGHSMRTMCFSPIKHQDGIRVSTTSMLNNRLLQVAKTGHGQNILEIGPVESQVKL